RSLSEGRPRRTRRPTRATLSTCRAPGRTLLHPPSAPAMYPSRAAVERAGQDEDGRPPGARGAEALRVCRRPRETTPGERLASAFVTGSAWLGRFRGWLAERLRPRGRGIDGYAPSIEERTQNRVDGRA